MPSHWLACPSVDQQRISSLPPLPDVEMGVSWLDNRPVASPVNIAVTMTRKMITIMDSHLLCGNYSSSKVPVTTQPPTLMLLLHCAVNVQPKKLKSTRRDAWGQELSHLCAFEMHHHQLFNENQVKKITLNRNILIQKYHAVDDYLQLRQFAF